MVINIIRFFYSNDIYNHIRPQSRIRYVRDFLTCEIISYDNQCASFATSSAWRGTSRENMLSQTAREQS